MNSPGPAAYRCVEDFRGTTPATTGAVLAAASDSIEPSGNKT